MSPATTPRSVRPAEAPADDFSRELAHLLHADQEDAAIDHVYTTLHDHLVNRRFDVCDRLLANLNVEHLTPAVQISVLTITAPAKAALKNRADVFVRVSQKLELERGPAATARTLAGLE